LTAGSGGYPTGVARPTWSGSISFGLVNVPVNAFTAVRDHDVHFHQLDQKSGARIRNKRVSAETGRQVADDDIVLGFEVSKGRYVTFDPEERRALQPASTRAIEITDFVALAEIDPIYFERSYWLAPDGPSAGKAYGLLLAAMEKSERVAIGTVVMRNKQYLTAVRPLDGALAMSTMRFADEVVPRADLELPRRAKVDSKALTMAMQLIEGLSASWAPASYHDTYTEELRERIARKDEGEETVEEAEEPAARVLDLMAALTASVDAAKKGRTAQSKSKAGSPTTRRKAG
jgi:DNA end-binding protein Ku